MNTDIHVILLLFQSMSYYCWMITWMKNINKFQIAKVQPQGVAYITYFSLVLLTKVLLKDEKRVVKYKTF